MDEPVVSARVRDALDSRILRRIARDLWSGELSRPGARGARLAPALVVVGVDVALCFASGAGWGDASLETRAWTDLAGYAVRLGVALGLLRALARGGAEGPLLPRIGVRIDRAREDAGWAVRISAIGGAGVTALAVAVVAGFLLLEGRIPAVPLPDEPLVVALVAIQAVIAAPIVEETIYRGVLQPPLHAKLPPWLVISAGGAIFALLHIFPYGHGGWGLEPFVGGLLMGIAFWLRRSLVAAVVVHAAGNLYLGVVGVALVLARSEWPHRFG